MQQQHSKSNHKNLTFEERFYIEGCLKEGLSFTEISALTKRNRKTISREIKNHRFAKSKNSKLKKSKCANLKICEITNLCNNTYCKRDVPCAKCKMRNCSQYCNRYVPGTCPKLLKPPYVCNGCAYPRTCGYDKMYYRYHWID